MEFEKILLSEQEIARCVRRVADEVSGAYAEGDNVLAVIVLEGARWFALDLVGEATIEMELCYVKAASYHGGFKSSGEVSLDGGIAEKIAGRNVLIIDDVYDTGRTLDKVAGYVKACGAADVKVCVMLEKRRAHEVEVEVDFVGAKIEDLFIVGYGLDYEGKLRELPYVAVMKEAEG